MVVIEMNGMSTQIPGQETVRWGAAEIVTTRF